MSNKEFFDELKTRFESELGISFFMIESEKNTDKLDTYGVFQDLGGYISQTMRETDETKYNLKTQDIQVSIVSKKIFKDAELMDSLLLYMENKYPQDDFADIARLESTSSISDTSAPDGKTKVFTKTVVFTFIRTIFNQVPETPIDLVSGEAIDKTNDIKEKIEAKKE